MPAVSVVITTLNRPVELQRAVASVLDQTFQDFEIIIVVDGPMATSESALVKLSDVRISIIRNPVNVGLAEARNVGVRAAKGAWISFLDDDDQWFPDKLALQLAEGEISTPHSTLVVCRYLEKSDSYERIWPEELPYTSVRFSEYLFCQRGMLLPSTYFVSRDLAINVPFTKGLRHIEDVDWLLRVAARSETRIAAVGTVQAIYNNYRDPMRESQNVPWRSFYLWALKNRQLFTALSFALFIVKSVVPAAREDGASHRERLNLLASAVILGSPHPRVFFYFIASNCFSRATKRNVRKVLSFRARSVHMVD